MRDAFNFELLEDYYLNNITKLIIVNIEEL